MHQAVTQVYKAPAQVRLFEVGEERIVEATGLVEKIRSHEHARTLEGESIGAKAIRREVVFCQVIEEPRFGKERTGAVQIAVDTPHRRFAGAHRYVRFDCFEKA
jgi:hypothetical protein